MLNPENETSTVKNEGSLEKIVFKGYRSGLILLIPEEGEFEKYIDEIRNHLEKACNFFQGAKVTIKLGKRDISEDQRLSLFKILEDNGLDIQRFQEENKPEVKSKGLFGNEHSIEENYIQTVTFNKTVRSGQKIEYDGNVLIWGDVNPGAEIIATGDIIVMGKLRGTVHAGARGNEQAKVFAFQLNPVQIRIAGFISRDAEKVKVSKRFAPEIAIIRDKMIVVEKYSKPEFGNK